MLGKGIVWGQALPGADCETVFKWKEFVGQVCRKHPWDNGEMRQENKIHKGVPYLHIISVGKQGSLDKLSSHLAGGELDYLSTYFHL